MFPSWLTVVAGLTAAVSAWAIGCLVAADMLRAAGTGAGRALRRVLRLSRSAPRTGHSAPASGQATTAAGSGVGGTDPDAWRRSVELISFDDLEKLRASRPNGPLR